MNTTNANCHKEIKKDSDRKRRILKE